MTENTAGEQPPPNLTDSPSHTAAKATTDWHPQGVWWLIAGGVGVLLSIFVGYLLLQQWPVLLTAISAVIAALGYLGFKQIDLRAWSQVIGKSDVARAGMGFLFALGVGLTIMPGVSLIHDTICDPFGCPPTDVLRFAIDMQPAQKPDDATLPENAATRNVLYQKLSCVGGLQGLGQDRNSLSDAARQASRIIIVLNGWSRAGDRLEVAAQLFDHRGIAYRAQPLVVRQPLAVEGEPRVLQILSMQNELFRQILQKFDLALSTEQMTRSTRLPTDRPQAFALNNQMVAALAQKNLPHAEELLDEALRLDPLYADAYNNRGYVRRLRNNLTGAVADYQQAATLLPCVPLYQFNLGYGYELNGDNASAIRAYTEAIALDPDYVKAINNLGFVYLQMQQFDKAMEWLSLGLKRDAKAPYLHKNLGRLYLAENRPAEAITALTEARRLFQGPYAEAIYYLALAYQKAGRNPEACTALVDYTPAVAVADALDDAARPQAVQQLRTALHCK